jgi:hypothetical protein
MKVFKGDLKNKMLDATLSEEDSHIDEHNLCDDIAEVGIEATSKKCFFF